MTGSLALTGSGLLTVSDGLTSGSSPHPLSSNLEIELVILAGSLTLTGSLPVTGATSGSGSERERTAVSSPQPNSSICLVTRLTRSQSSRCSRRGPRGSERSLLLFLLLEKDKRVLDVGILLKSTPGRFNVLTLSSLRVRREAPASLASLTRGSRDSRGSRGTGSRPTLRFRGGSGS